jgi:hypothetical protein
VPSFLDVTELDVLRADYAAHRSGPAGQAARSNKNYAVVTMQIDVLLRFDARLRAFADEVRVATGIYADANVGGLYFATADIQFSWHQDHEAFFILQDVSQYLNFYLPIIKPDVRRSNLCVVPFDTLLQRAPTQGAKLVGVGASRLVAGGGTTRVFDDENGLEYELPVDIEELAVTPELNAGDLLLMRGDMIHRTQDADTVRVAASFRRIASTSVMRLGRLSAGGPRKREMLANNEAAYERLLRCFKSHRADELTVGQFVEFVRAERLRGQRLVI